MVLNKAMLLSGAQEGEGLYTLTVGTIMPYPRIWGFNNDNTSYGGVLAGDLQPRKLKLAGRDFGEFSNFISFSAPGTHYESFHLIGYSGTGGEVIKIESPYATRTIKINPSGSGTYQITQEDIDNNIVLFPNTPGLEVPIRISLVE